MLFCRLVAGGRGDGALRRFSGAYRDETKP